MSGHLLHVKTIGNETDTEISIGNEITRSLPFYNFLNKTASRFALIADQNVAEKYGLQLAAELTAEGFEVHLLTFPEGEGHKIRSTKQDLEDQMLAKELGRGDGVIALGGGVTSDLAGFVASTYCRGVSLICIPTTLMGMVDASLGGKNGVNTNEGKNLIGSFHFPKAVFINPDFLKTLPKHEMRNGMAEIIKYGLIASKELFEMLEQGQKNIEELILRSCEIKKMVIESDPKEQGFRRILNFGHTIGHALEFASSFELSHGEAIAIGMMTEAYLSFKLGHLTFGVLEQMSIVFKQAGFRLKFPQLDRQQIRTAMSFDKKTIRSTPRMVLLKAVGQVERCNGNYCSSIEPALLEDGLNWMFKEFGSQ
jgi:3-dehydroquinate synthase